MWGESTTRHREREERERDRIALEVDSIGEDKEILVGDNRERPQDSKLQLGERVLQVTEICDRVWECAVSLSHSLHLRSPRTSTCTRAK